MEILGVAESQKPNNNTVSVSLCQARQPPPMIVFESGPELGLLQPNRTGLRRSGVYLSSGFDKDRALLRESE